MMTIQEVDEQGFMILPKFTPIQQCPKCGEVICVKYSCQLCQNDKGQEYLKSRCSCGYEVYMHTKDWVPAEVSES